jgi:hypothetical protein
MSLFNVLNRRIVLRIGAAYIVTSWLLIQIAETTFPLFGFSDGPGGSRLKIIPATRQWWLISNQNWRNNGRFWRRWKSQRVPVSKL